MICEKKVERNMIKKLSDLEMSRQVGGKLIEIWEKMWGKYIERNVGKVERIVSWKKLEKVERNVEKKELWFKKLDLGKSFKKC